MKSSFIIVTPYGPNFGENIGTRYFLNLMYKKAITEIKYDNFNLFLFGHLPGESNGKIHFVQTKGITKEQKLNEAKNYFITNNIKADYFVRLDDDDLINPEAFNLVNKMQCEVYYDLFHCFYDITSGKIAQQKRFWIPNTCIMKAEHAFKNLFLDNALLFNFKHGDAWHQYFKSFKVNAHFSDKSNPLYLRILSPTSITSSINKDKYKEYLAGFGSWNNQYPRPFLKYIRELQNYWDSKNGYLINYQFPRAIIQRIKQYFF
jgi:hypothetical protein